MSLPLSRAVVLAVSFLRFLGLFCGACSCGFVIGSVSPLSMLAAIHFGFCVFE